MILNILNSNSNERIERIEQYRTISPISFSKLSFKQLINVFCLKQHQIHIIFLKIVFLSDLCVLIPPHDFKYTNRVPSPQNVVAVLPENSKKNNKSG